MYARTYLARVKYSSFGSPDGATIRRHLRRNQPSIPLEVREAVVNTGIGIFSNKYCG